MNLFQVSLILRTSNLIHTLAVPGASCTSGSHHFRLLGSLRMSRHLGWNWAVSVCEVERCWLGFRQPRRPWLR
jgi:hypothetical protein